VTETSEKAAVFVPSGTDPAEASEGGTRTVRVLASTRRRVAAQLLNLAIMAVAMLVLPGLAAVALAMGGSDGGAPSTLAVMVAIGIYIVVCLLVTRIVMMVRWGCVPGQFAVGIRVVGPDGVSHPTWRQAFTRWGTSWETPTAEGTWPWDDYRTHKQDTATGRCIHDARVNTVVVMADKSAK
jgi:hypothetical protein